MSENKRKARELAEELVRNEQQFKPAIRKRKTRAHKEHYSEQLLLQAQITNLLGGDVDLGAMGTGAGQMAFALALGTHTDESSPYVQAVLLINKVRQRAHLHVV